MSLMIPTSFTWNAYWIWFFLLSGALTIAVETSHDDFVSLYSMDKAHLKQLETNLARLELDKLS